MVVNGCTTRSSTSLTSPPLSKSTASFPTKHNIRFTCRNGTERGKRKRLTSSGQTWKMHSPSILLHGKAESPAPSVPTMNQIHQKLFNYNRSSSKFSLIRHKDTVFVFTYMTRVYGKGKKKETCNNNKV